MIYVGIDIDKNTHLASAMNSDGEILLEPFSFQNNSEGFQKFISKLSNILHDNSHGRYNKEDAIRLRESAKNFVGVDVPTLSLQIKQAILQIELYTEQIEEVEKLSKQILDEMESKLLTISGMSYNQCNCNTWFYW